MIYPFRMEAGYQELMAGATYVVMPSLYEPFGAATEPYLAGTPVVARATGGLTDQVTDIAANPDRATGFLYREQIPASVDVAENWQRIQAFVNPTRGCRFRSTERWFPRSRLPSCRLATFFATSRLDTRACWRTATTWLSRFRGRGLQKSTTPGMS